MLGASAKTTHYHAWIPSMLFNGILQTSQYRYRHDSTIWATCGEIVWQPGGGALLTGTDKSDGIKSPNNCPALACVGMENSYSKLNVPPFKLESQWEQLTIYSFSEHPFSVLRPGSSLGHRNYFKERQTSHDCVWDQSAILRSVLDWYVHAMNPFSSPFFVS